MSDAGRLRWVHGAAAVAGLATGASLVIDRWMERMARPRVFARVEDVPPREAAIVPGCRPSNALDDRLAAALALYEAGAVRRVLVSGNGRAPRASETDAMARWLEARGVPAEAIGIDPEGLRTLATFRHAARAFGVRSAVVCTQRYHLPRALYLAAGEGIDAVGLVADRRRYLRPYRDRARELVARTLAVVDAGLRR